MDQMVKLGSDEAPDHRAAAENGYDHESDAGAPLRIRNGFAHFIGGHFARAKEHVNDAHDANDEAGE